MLDKKDGLKASHMMNGVILYADRSENLLYITKLLFNENANAVVVREQGVPKGIITTKDILRALIKFDRDPAGILAGEIMSSPIVTIEHDEDISRVRDLMLDAGIQKLPVKRAYDIIGMIVQADLLRDIRWLDPDR